MPKFQKKAEPEQAPRAASEQAERRPTKGELDAKHQEALEAKAIVSWKSPVRIFKARSRRYFTKIILYGLILILAAVAFGEFFLVGVIIALMFVAFVLATAEPEMIDHKITSMGIITGGRAFLWEDLDSFWLEKRGDDRVLVVETYLRFPSRLIILLPPEVSDRTLLDILEKHLHFHRVPVHTLFDKWAMALQRRINLD